MTARAWFAFLSVSVLWGIPYFFIKIAVDDGVPPAFLAWARVTLGAVILLAISWRLGLLPTLRGRGRALLGYALFEIVIPFPLIAAGEQHVASSLAAILIASVPLIVALLALRFDHEERAGGLRLAGLIIGFTGVVALVGLDVAGDSGELLGAAAILIAAVGYAIGPMLLKLRLAERRPARDDGRRARDRLGRAHPGGDRGPAPRCGVGRRDRLVDRARRSLHGRGVRALRHPGDRGRARAGRR